MKLLTREDILHADDFKRELVQVPEWGGSVYVRVLSGLERDQLELEIRSSTLGDSPKRQIRALYCAAAICDGSNRRLFSDSDIDALGAKSGVALDRVWKVAVRINKVTDDDVEELAKNSEPSRADTSASS